KESRMLSHLRPRVRALLSPKGERSSCHRGSDMSSDESRPACASASRRHLAFGACLMLVVGAALAACGDSGFRPLYAPSASGVDARERLKEVDFAPIPGRVGQRIRNDLIFEGTGGGNPLPPQYRFEVVLQENVTSTLVNIRGEVAGAIYNVTASFR